MRCRVCNTETGSDILFCSQHVEVGKKYVVLDMNFLIKGITISGMKKFSPILLMLDANIDDNKRNKVFIEQYNEAKAKHGGSQKPDVELPQNDRYFILNVVDIFDGKEPEKRLAGHIDHIGNFCKVLSLLLGENVSLKLIDSCFNTQNTPIAGRHIRLFEPAKIRAHDHKENERIIEYSLVNFIPISKKLETEKYLAIPLQLFSSALEDSESVGIDPDTRENIIFLKYYLALESLATLKTGREDGTNAIKELLVNESTYLETNLFFGKIKIMKGEDAFDLCSYMRNGIAHNGIAKFGQRRRNQMDLWMASNKINSDKELMPYFKQYLYAVLTLLLVRYLFDNPVELNFNAPDDPLGLLV